MKAAANQFFLRLPFVIQDLLVTGYDAKSYSMRRSGAYQEWRNYLRYWHRASVADTERERSNRLALFLAHATSKSEWYSIHAGKKLQDFPILTKGDIVRNLERITTIRDTRRRIASYTGGTSGASMKVYYESVDVQERAAFLDHFRAQFGYELGRKVAWFSGKIIATERDVQRGRCYRDDLLYNIRYFSTFHVKPGNFDAYWEALDHFGAEYLVGFPSSLYGICSIAADRGLKTASPSKVFFPTAETVLPEYRRDISAALGCDVRDQYASSEGAPFIFECGSGQLHIHPLSGVFEVVDGNMQPAQEGELLVTSFSTRGTPLIRYRIGDRIRLTEHGRACECGSMHPLVERIDGRTSDYVLSPAGRVNLGNLSNCTKGIDGIVCFQVVQSVLDSITVSVVSDDRFDSVQEAEFLAAIRERVGHEMYVVIERVADIPVEASGKFRIVKNKLPAGNH